jgi:hypothetical protein
MQLQGQHRHLKLSSQPGQAFILAVVILLLQLTDRTDIQLSFVCVS